MLEVVAYVEEHMNLGCYIPLEDATKEVNYMGNQHRSGFNAGGFAGYQQGSSDGEVHKQVA